MGPKTPVSRHKRTRHQNLVLGYYVVVRMPRRSSPEPEPEELNAGNELYKRQEWWEQLHLAAHWHQEGHERGWLGYLSTFGGAILLCKTVFWGCWYGSHEGFEYKSPQYVL